MSSKDRKKPKKPDSKRKNDQASGCKITPSDKELLVLNPNAAGIDIGSRSHFASVSPDITKNHVREFSAVTEGLLEMAEWLQQCGVKTVAMESTGVYWIPAFRILEEAGLDVRLIDARKLKNVPGRKTDVEDCQWIRRLHMFGLLDHAFVPPQPMQTLRILVRHRGILIDESSRYVLRMQKALEQMNLKLRTVISNIVGKTGTQIIEAIIAGNHNPKNLAQYRDGRCKATVKEIEQALTGNFREDVLYTLESAYETYIFLTEQRKKCDSKIEQALKKMIPSDQKLEPMPPSSKKPQSRRAQGNAPTFDLEGHIYELTRVNLTAIPGINAVTALKVISHCGFDMSQWKSSKHFASWLSLCPGNKISGGKSQSGRTRKSSNPAAAALRMAAESLERGTSFLSVFYRRIKARKGGAKAITAAAHKLAVIIYEMLKSKKPFNELGDDWYDKNYAQRTINKCKKMLESLGQKVVLEPLEGNL